jgi:hypothetical protein
MAQLGLHLVDILLAAVEDLLLYKIKAVALVAPEAVDPVVRSQEDLILELTAQPIQAAVAAGDILIFLVAPEVLV